MLRACAFLLFTALLPAEQWTKVTSPHFELYSTAGEKKAREAILYFEQVRTFFLQASPSKKAPEFPVRIIAFRSEKEYQPYRKNEFASAYYTRNDRRDYIVMDSIAAERYPVAIHEYSHLIVEHSGLKLPVWLNEGWADVNSTLKPVANKRVQIGDILPGRAQELLTGKWIDLAALTNVELSSPLYNEKSKAGMFYAESWALTHMLSLSPGYQKQFTSFLEALVTGKSAADAFSFAFHKSLPEVQKDLQGYLKRNAIYAAIYDLPLEKAAEDPAVSVPAALETDLVLADLLAVTGKKDRARSAYEQLARSNPGKPEIEESLGYMALQSGDRANAVTHFNRAFTAGTKNPQLCYDLALLQKETGSAEREIFPALRKAIELKPDYIEARLQLGFAQLNAKQYGSALATLAPVKSVDPDRASYLFNALAYANVQLGNADVARTNAELARKWAKEPSQSQRADELLRYLDSQKERAAEQAAIASAATGGPKKKRRAQLCYLLLLRPNPISPPITSFRRAIF